MMTRMSNHAVSNGITLNPDTDHVNRIISGLKRNTDIYGDAYCPCKIEKIPENICPCQSHIADIKKDGHCRCRLFFSGDVSS